MKGRERERERERGQELSMKMSIFFSSHTSYRLSSSFAADRSHNNPFPSRLPSSPSLPLHLSLPLSSLRFEFSEFQILLTSALCVCEQIHRGSVEYVQSRTYVCVRERERKRERERERERLQVCESVCERVRCTKGTPTFPLP